MARARAGYDSQPESRVKQVRPARRIDYQIAASDAMKPHGEGEWFARLECGHWILRLRRPRVDSVIVCWSCARMLSRGTR